MRWIHKLSLRLRSLFYKGRVERELSDELHFHLEKLMEQNLGKGMAPEEARYAALRELGGVEQIKEECRDMRGVSFLETLLQDVRYGLRQLRRNPGFAAVAIITLALGIGANTAIFTVFDAVLLRLLPVRQPSQLVMLTDPNGGGSGYGMESGTRDLLGYPEFEYLRDHNSVFSGVFAVDSELPVAPVRIGPGEQSAGQPETARVSLVSGGYFSTLGIRALRGQVFTSDVDKARGASPVVVASFEFWQRRLGHDPAALGEKIQIRKKLFTIIGVTPPGFSGVTMGDEPDLWAPLTMQEAILPGRDMLSPVAAMQNEYIWLQAMGRLRPGVTLQQAQANITVLFQRMLESQAGPGLTVAQRKHYLDQQIKVRAGARGVAPVRGVMGDPLELLMALVGVLLLIACANVANLLLARGAGRQREFAIRAALGAGRSRLIRQLLAESFLLAFFGAAAGILLARWASSLLVRTMPGADGAAATTGLRLALDWRVIVFMLLVTVITAFLFGLLPAWRAGRVDLTPTLKSAAGAAPGRVRNRWLPAGKLLVIGQLSASLILLMAAGLFIHSLARLSEVSLGFSPERLVLFRVDAAAAGYEGNAMTPFCRRLLGRLRAIPGVSSATVSSGGLFEGADSGDPIAVEGYAPAGGELPNSRMDLVGPGYFRAVGIPILLGRGIEDGDAAPAQRVAVINQAFAQRYFARANPIGKTVRDTFPGNPGSMIVVGIAANARHNSLRETIEPRIYFPLYNPLWPEREISFEVRAAADPVTVSAAIRDAVAETSPALLPVQMETLPALIDRSLGSTRFITGLAGLFALLAAALAGIGLYGVMAYTVARQTREIGIRMALGAVPGEIMRQVLRETIFLAVIGVLIGIPLAIAGARLVRSLLFGVGRIDAAAFVSAAVLLAAVAALAGFVPARRAAKVDPMVALRNE
ncbi:MAG TPA: ABC transporter permease [Terriglobia bacterium]|nr:ABC transporter permease [Terriglobia bacterium]